MKIIIKSFNGIGDLLFVTPTLRVVKEAYPDSVIIVNTNRPSLLKNNPFVDKIETKNEGVFLDYPAPAGGMPPYQHHIISDWEIVCKAYNITTERPALKPELYIEKSSTKRKIIGVQIEHKGLWHNKKVWPYFKKLANENHFEPIPHITNNSMSNLVKKISGYKCVVCAEGGISHIAKALGVPAVVLYGGFADPLWNGYEDQTNLTSNVDCKYCYNAKPCERGYKCWDQISVSYVEDIALQMRNKLA